MKKPIPLILVVNFVFILASIVWYSFAEERITLTTYYPAPYGDYLRLSTNSMSVGSAYRSQTLTDGVLIVNDSVSIGTSSFSTNNRLDIAGGVAVGSGYVTSNAPSNGMIIQGMVSIGNNQPITRLYVQSQAINSTIFRVSSYDRVRDIFDVGESSGGGVVDMRDSSGNIDVKLNTQGDSYFRGGRVGIGRWDPSGILEVSHTSSAHDFVVNQTSGYVGIGTTNPQSNLHINTGGQLQIGLTSDTQYANLTSTNLKFQNNGSSSWSSISQYGSGKGLSFITNGSTRMVIEGDGDVAIGKQTASAKLDVAGNVTVNGYFKIEEKMPIFFKNYTGLGDNIRYDTGISTIDYICGVCGFAALDGDIQEHDYGDIIQIYMYQEGRTWRIRGDFRTHNNNESWDVNIFCVSRKLSKFGIPPTP